MSKVISLYCFIKDTNVTISLSEEADVGRYGMSLAPSPYEALTFFFFAIVKLHEVTSVSPFINPRSNANTLIQ